MLFLSVLKGELVCFCTFYDELQSQLFGNEETVDKDVFMTGILDHLFTMAYSENVCLPTFVLPGRVGLMRFEIDQEVVIRHI